MGEDLMVEIVNILNNDFIRKITFLSLTLMISLSCYVNNVFADDSDNTGNSGSNTIDYSSDLDLLKVDIHNIYSDVDNLNDIISSYMLSKYKTTFDVSNLYFSKINNYFIRNDDLLNWLIDNTINSSNKDIVVWLNRNYPNYFQITNFANTYDYVNWFNSNNGVELSTYTFYNWENSVSLDNARIFYLKVDNQIIFDGITDTYNSYVLNNLPSVLSDSLSSNSSFSTYIIAIFVVLLFIVFKSLIWGV